MLDAPTITTISTSLLLQYDAVSWRHFANSRICILFLPAGDGWGIRRRGSHPLFGENKGLGGLSEPRDSEPVGDSCWNDVCPRLTTISGDTAPPGRLGGNHAGTTAGADGAVGRRNGRAVGTDRGFRSRSSPPRSGFLNARFLRSRVPPAHDRRST